MAATNQQVQAFVDQRIRPRCEQIRALVLNMQDDIAEISDVYANLTNSPTWVDNNTSNPPHFMSASDVLGINSFLHNAVTNLTGDGQYPIVLESCVRPVGVS